MKTLHFVFQFGLLAIMFGTSIAQATLSIVSQSAVVDPSQRNATFTLTFNRVPDFFTVDQYNRRAVAFQYFIEIHNDPAWNSNDSVLRGTEMVSSGAFPIRNISPSSGDPGSGGWGSIRGWVSSQLMGSTLTFVADLNLLGADKQGPVLTGGKFKYHLEVYEYGKWTGSSIDALSTTIPEPASAVLILLGTVWMKSKHRRKLVQS